MNQHNPSNHPHTPPHKSLGRFLKTMRQRLQESLGETSGAVEIAVEQLDRFERGAERPSEDILMLLISHFGLPEDEAVTVWELAGYDRRARTFNDNDDYEDYKEAAQQRQQPMHIMLLAMDNRILYTNGVEVVTDNAGVVMNFTQTDGANASGNNPLPSAVSRVGMSYAQAEQLLQTLQRALLHKKYLSGPKRLPPSSSPS
jgi:transcriptional regulator with XRE-family HTH domain